MQLDFGGIVKEYAADRVLALLQQQQADISMLVNLAGDIAVSAAQPDQSAWLIGIRHPQTKKAIAQLPIKQGGLATSGDYERYIDIDGKRYCHL